jgi:sensor histidine kinase regulating citrate/malate metabolism
MRTVRSSRNSAARQRGISFIGLVFVAVVLACVGVVVAQVIPTLIEYQAIYKAANKAKEGSTVPEIRAIFDRAQAIDDFQSVTGKDLDIKKVNDKVVISFAYEREIPLFGPAYLVLKYKGETN